MESHLAPSDSGARSLAPSPRDRRADPVLPKTSSVTKRAHIDFWDDLSLSGNTPLLLGLRLTGIIVRGELPMYAPKLTIIIDRSLAGLQIVGQLVALRDVLSVAHGNMAD